MDKLKCGLPNFVSKSALSISVAKKRKSARCIVGELRFNGRGPRIVGLNMG